MLEAQEIARRPFHKMIVHEIENAYSYSKLIFLAGIIKKTEIKENHDAIIKAWWDLLERMNINNGDCRGVIASLEEQKKKAEDRKRAEKQENHDALFR